MGKTEKTYLNLKKNMHKIAINRLKYIQQLKKSHFILWGK